jgi:hypothetical protein
MNLDQLDYYVLKYGSIVLMIYVLLRITLYWRTRKRNHLNNIDYISTVAMFFAGALGLWHFYGYIFYIYAVGSMSVVETIFERNVKLIYEEAALFIVAFIITLVSLIIKNRYYRLDDKLR